MGSETENECAMNQRGGNEAAPVQFRHVVLVLREGRVQVLGVLLGDGVAALDHEFHRRPLRPRPRHLGPCTQRGGFPREGTG